MLKLVWFLVGWPWGLGRELVHTKDTAPCSWTCGFLALFTQVSTSQWPAVNWGALVEIQQCVPCVWVVTVAVGLRSDNFMSDITFHGLGKGWRVLGGLVTMNADALWVESSFFLASELFLFYAHLHIFNNIFRIHRMYSILQGILTTSLWEVLYVTVNNGQIHFHKSWKHYL